MEHRISLLTLGAADLGRARHSYEAMGWPTARAVWGGYSGAFAGPDGLVPCN